MVPYEMPPQGGLTVAGGETGCFELSFPSRTVISKIVIIQTAGDPVNFTAALFNHEVACLDEESLSDSVAPYTGDLPADLFRVTPNLAGVAGSLIYFSDSATGGHGFVFFSQETAAQHRSGRLGNVRRIHLRITPAGTGQKTFAIALGGLVAIE